MTPERLSDLLMKANWLFLAGWAILLVVASLLAFRHTDEEEPHSPVRI
ncbi:MAG TPA: hypothetical protein VH437_00240 [Terriglobales bacterium]